MNAAEERYVRSKLGTADGSFKHYTLRDYQTQLMLAEEEKLNEPVKPVFSTDQAGSATFTENDNGAPKVPINLGHGALQDYQTQMMLLEQHKRKQKQQQLMMNAEPSTDEAGDAEVDDLDTEPDTEESSSDNASEVLDDTNDESTTLQDDSSAVISSDDDSSSEDKDGAEGPSGETLDDYQFQLMLLEQARKRQGQQIATNAPSREAGQSTQHQAGKPADTLRGDSSVASSPNDEPSGEDEPPEGMSAEALEDYQFQLMLLEQARKRQGQQTTAPSWDGNPSTQRSASKAVEAGVEYGDEDPTTLVPHSKRPKKPKFHAVQSSGSASNLVERLQSFLPQLRDANSELEAAGRPDKEAVEIVEATGEGAEAGEPQEDEDAGVEEQEAGQYVEMNVLSGVFENTEGRNDGSGSESEAKGSEHGEPDVMGKLMGRKQRSKAVGIQEVQ